MTLRSRYLSGFLSGGLVLAGVTASGQAPAVNQTPAGQQKSVAKQAPAGEQAPAAKQPPAGEQALAALAQPPTRETGSPTQDPGSVSPSAVPPSPPLVLGASPLPRRRDGYGVVRPTPAQLVDRRLPTVDVLLPPASGGFESTISPVPPQVLARSTWRPGCPVPVSQLRYLTMSFHGFDGRVHTGEMLVNVTVAKTVMAVFRKLFAAGFPIEEMRVTAASELDLPPTGDGNNTSAFVCRPIVSRGKWSAHAYGLAIDLNPFHNPYIRGDLVVPELASAYLQRNRIRPGMALAGSPAVTAFEAAGWTWGGRWTSPVDFMHFSATGH